MRALVQRALKNPVHPVWASERYCPHHFLDGFARFVGVVEGNGANIVVQDVGFDNSVEDVTANESKVAVNGGSGTTSKVPGFGLVVGEGGVGVLEVSDGHYN